METEKRLKLIEEAIVMMKDLIVRHDERLDDFDRKMHESREEMRESREEMRESREDFNFKINTLIDSQIRTESDLLAVKDSIIELRKTAESTLKRVEKLENKN